MIRAKCRMAQERPRKSCQLRKNLTQQPKTCSNCCVPRSELALDSTDLAVISLLRQDARRSLIDIGTCIGLSPSAVKRRLDRLEQSGVIKRYTVVVDEARLGRPLEAFTEVRFYGNARVDSIARLGEGIPEVQAVFTIAGDPDALVWLRVRDVNDLKRVVDQLRATGQVSGTKTLMVLGTSGGVLG